MEKPFDINDLIEQVDRADIVSFDIFDTLVVRPYVNPTDVFRLVEREFNAPGFYEERVRAELKVRAILHNESLDEETTYDIIYDEVAPRFSHLKEAELALEMRSIFRNEEMGAVYDHALAQGKRIVIASDMYLPEDFIRSLLSNCGYDGYEQLFLSSTIKKQKVGTLFQHMEKSLGIRRPRKLLHIGDNMLGDVLSARNAGYSAFYYPKVIERFGNNSLLGTSALENISRSGNVDLSHAVMAAALHQTFHNDVKDPIYQIGAEIVFPVALLFSQWVLHQCTLRDIRKIYFCSRDGFLFKKIFDHLLDENSDFTCENLYVSRRAAAAAVESVLTRDESLFFYGLGGKSFSPKELWASTFINSRAMEEEFLRYCQKNYQGKRVDQSALENFIAHNREEFDVAMRQEMDGLIAYMNSLRVFDEPCAIVDIGWSGTIQRALHLAANASGRRLDAVGFYLATGDECLLPHDRGFGYLYDRGLPSENKEVLFLKTFFGDVLDLVELFFTVPGRSVRSYASSEGRTVPTFLPAATGEQKRMQIAARINEGVEDVLTTYKDSPWFVHKFAVEALSPGIIEVVKTLADLPDSFQNTLADVNIYLGHSEQSSLHN
ncbi:MAG: hypothetical protein KGM18_01645 [Sphingomonadales bacterium]|nr:hypothetical protein [Sphingomonadales bacterium]